MQKQLIILFISIQFPFLLSSQQIDQKALNIIEKIDKNMFSKTQIVTSEMIVYGKRKKRVIRSKGYSKGKENNFTEYLSPEREKGTKIGDIKEIKAQVKKIGYSVLYMKAFKALQEAMAKIETLEADVKTLKGE